MTRSLALRSTLLLLFAAIAAQPAAALTIDFEEFAHGEIVTASQGVLISTVNIGGGPDLGVAFDTNRTGTADEDLQFYSPGISGGENGWRTGNLAPRTDMGNILIIQEHIDSCRGSICSNPDDEGSRPAGSITFDFRALGTYDEFAMDLIDVEESRRSEPGSIEFFLGGIAVQEVMFSDFGAPEVLYGNNSANHLFVLDGVDFDVVRVNLGGSGGIDNIRATNAVPEPTAAVLFAAGLLAVRSGIARRQR